MFLSLVERFCGVNKAHRITGHGPTACAAGLASLPTRRILSYGCNNGASLSPITHATVLIIIIKPRVHVW